MSCLLNNLAYLTAGIATHVNVLMMQRTCGILSVTSSLIKSLSLLHDNNDGIEADHRVGCRHHRHLFQLEEMLWLPLTSVRSY